MKYEVQKGDTLQRIADRFNVSVAALRVLANAARLVSDNPALANLRLLQAIESSKGATTIVIGNPAAPMAAGVPSVPPTGS